MEDRLEISLRPAEGVNPKGLLKRIARELRENCFNEADPDDESTGEVDQIPSLKASEIMRRAIATITQQGPDERQRLLQEQQQVQAAIRNSTGDLRLIHEEALEATKEKRFQAVLNVLKNLKDLGVDIAADAEMWQPGHESVATLGSHEK